MKKIIYTFLLTFLTIVLFSCKDNTINITIDFENFKIINKPDNKDVKLEVLDNELMIEIYGVYKNEKLVINNTKVSQSKYSIGNNKLVYKFKLGEYLNSNDTVDPIVKFDLNFGSFEKKYYENFNKETSFIISETNNQYTRGFSIFNNEIKGLKYHYKIFIKHDKDSNVYIPLHIDKAENLVEDIKNINYDYIITSNSGNQLLENDNKLKLLFNDNNLDKIFVLDGKINDGDEIKVDVYNNNDFEVRLSQLLNYNLPKLFSDQLIFVGWTYLNEIIDELYFPKVKDNILVFDLKPKWKNIPINKLYTFIDELIPDVIDKDVKLVKKIAGYNLIWKSSNEKILTNDGKFNIPYKKTDINLTVDIINIEGEKVRKIYDLETVYKKELNIPISSSYIYRSYSLVNNDFFNILDIINTAFIIADKDGDLNGLSFLRNVDEYIIPNAKKYGNWVILSIAPESEWSSFSKNEDKLYNFANNIVNIINEYGFDGVDIDWETPKVGEEKQYTKLMKIVYEKVKKNNENHLVTTAITGGPFQPPMYDLHNSNKYIDYLNVMSYGMLNNDGGYQNALYTNTTYHSARYKVGKTINQVSIEDSIKIFNNYGLPNNKLIIGLAFYATKQIKRNNKWESSGSVNYSTILNLIKSENYIEYYDENTGVPYLMNVNGNEFYSYDNRKSILVKIDYIKKNNLAGTMFWEFGADTTYTLLYAIKEGFE